MSDEQKDSFIDIYRKLCGWHGSSATGRPPKVTSKSSVKIIFNIVDVYFRVSPRLALLLMSMRSVEDLVPTIFQWVKLE